MDKITTWLLAFTAEYGGKVVANIETIKTVSHVLAMLVIFAWGAISYRRRLKKKTGSLRGLLLAFPGKISVWFCEPTLKSEYDGRPFSVALMSPDRNTPKIMAIKMETPLSFKLAIYKDSPFYWMHKKFGVYKDLDVCESDFNKEFLVTSDNQATAHNYLNDSQRNQAVRDFFRAGFFSFTVSGREVCVIKADYSAAADLEPGVMTGRIKMLAVLAREL